MLRDGTKITPEISRWIGLLITDGSLSKTGWFLKFTNKEKELRDEFKESTFRLFGIRASEIKSNGRTEEIRVNSTKLVNWVNKNFEIPLGNKSKIVRVPKRILDCEDKRVIRSFLQGVFDGDGSVFFSKKHHVRQVDLSSGSRVFLQQVQHLLLKLGIKSRLKNTELRLLITRKDEIKKFFKLIGFRHPQRRKKLLNLIELLSPRQNG